MYAVLSVMMCYNSQTAFAAALAALQLPQKTSREVSASTSLKMRAAKEHIIHTATHMMQVMKVMSLGLQGTLVETNISTIAGTHLTSEHACAYA